MLISGHVPQVQRQTSDVSCQFSSSLLGTHSVHSADEGRLPVRAPQPAYALPPRISRHVTDGSTARTYPCTVGFGCCCAPGGRLRGTARARSDRRRAHSNVQSFDRVWETIRESTSSYLTVSVGMPHEPNCDRGLNRPLRWGTVRGRRRTT